MLFHAYLKNAVAYVPTVVKLQTGADVDPVAVVSVANTAGLRGDLLDAIGKNAIVPPPPKDNWRPPILLKYAEDLDCLCPRRGGLEHPEDGWEFSYRRPSEPSQRIWGERPSPKPAFYPDPRSMMFSDE